MYRSILVPLDGSTFAEHALPIARSIAHRAGATLHLVSVHMPVAIGYVDDLATLDDRLEAENKAHERAYLDEVIKRLAMDPKVPVTSTLVEGWVGRVAEVLRDYVMAKNIDLVVMTTHGRGALSRFWLGSVADELVRQAPVPILLVRPREGEETPDISRDQIFQHILIPLDGSTLSEKILEPAITLGRLTQADYTLLRVIELMLPANFSPEYSVGVDQQLLELLQVDARHYLEEVAERLRGRMLQVQTKIVFNYQPALAILEEAEKQGSDLIAMETHGHGGLTRLLVGSVADKVLRSAPVPVLLHRPRDKSS
ncbi:MAG TPA: universal stress protein [Candidatus Limnocylindrales bacterium]|nr:universal stress protein [Candidatus Limnocylindrales bacterium]